MKFNHFFKGPIARNICNRSSLAIANQDSISKRLEKNFFFSSLKLQGVYGWAALVIDILSSCLNFSLVLLLFVFFENFTSNQETVHTTAFLLILIITGRGLLSLGKGYLELKIKKRFCQWFNSLLLYSCWGSENKPTLARIIGRDFYTIVERVLISVTLIAQPISLFIGVGLVWYVMGDGVLTLLSLFLFIPLSLYIAKKTIPLVDAIYDVSKKRLDTLSHWLQFRDLLLNWKEEKPVLTEIENLLDKENKLRNKDSTWRCLDLYTIIFGRILPIAFVLLFSSVFFEQTGKNFLFLFWMSVPFTALIMDFGRQFADFRLCQNAHREIINNIQLKKQVPAQNIILDDSWEIWEGTLADNVLSSQFTQEHDLLKKLRIEDELLSKSHDASAFQLKDGGINISAGQKTRLLLIRGLHLALELQKPLQVKLSLSSLDPELCQKLMAVLSDLSLKCDIALDPYNEQLIQHQLKNNVQIFQNTGKDVKPSTPKVGSNPEKTAASLMKDFIHFINLKTFLFLLPAFGAGYLGTLTYALTESAKWSDAIPLVCLAFVLIAFSLYLGVSQESYVRQWAKQKVTSGLQREYLHSTTDLYQRLSKDFLNVVERISWYIHDICWYAAIALVTLLSLMFAFNITGLIIASFFIIGGGFVWHMFAQRIAQAREHTIAMTNNLLASGNQLCAFGTASELLPVFNLKVKNLTKAITSFYSAHAKLYWLKLGFSVLTSLLSGLLMAAMVIPSFFITISPSVMAFMLTSIMTMDSTIVILLFGLSGFNALRISVSRLASMFGPAKVQQAFPLMTTKNGFKFTGGINSITKMHYHEYDFDMNKTYQITGGSGKGKSQFLKVLAGIIPNEMEQRFTSIHCPVLYVDRQANKLLKKTPSTVSPGLIGLSQIHAFLRKKLFDDQYKIIILDELLVDFPILDSINFIQTLSDDIKRGDYLLFIVDHRLSLEDQLIIHRIQKSIVQNLMPCNGDVFSIHHTKS